MSHLTNTVYSYLNLSAFRSPARALPRSLSLFLSLARSFQCQFAMHAQHVKPWELRNARTVSNQPINKHYTLDWSYEERRWSGDTDNRKNKAFWTHCHHSTVSIGLIAGHRWIYQPFHYSEVKTWYCIVGMKHDATERRCCESSVRVPHADSLREQRD